MLASGMQTSIQTTDITMKLFIFPQAQQPAGILGS
jgi:hypothetical protein